MLSSTFVHRWLIPSILYVTGVVAVPASRSISPSITLDKGTFEGVTDGVTNKFLGIPFAKPSTGGLRFRLPVPNDAYTGSHLANVFGPSCPQQGSTLKLPGEVVTESISFVVNQVLNVVVPESEDCLTLNVWAPASATSTDKLPVVAWIYGGGFQFGGTSTYDGGVIVQRSIELGEPIIYVSMNYRISAFGFLASKEVKEAGVGNIGMQDQRQALRWIQKYITAFGGDPTKVTIWGESAGAISVALHMVANDGNNEGLFRGAFMESGSPIPVGDITNGQQDYDAIVQETGCTGAADTLECLRQVPFEILKAAVDQSPAIFSFQSLKLAWLPRADGTFITAPPQSLVQQGQVSSVPFVTGDCDDEGTLFATSSLNLTTDAEVRDYIKTVFLPNAPESDIDQLLTLYPSDVTKGSPFDTGDLNAITPQFKRIAAILGDVVFQAPRRFFLQQRAGKQNTWSFMSKRLKATPVLGSLHGSDLLNSYSGGDLTDYLVNFVNHLDPNGAGSVISWPQYDATSSSPQILTFLDGMEPEVITPDTFRQEAINFVIGLDLRNPE
ncbi:carotenoid ester lipase precursor [Abortiporus biennis]|nr:carotenoid ester lipase precursor [Abortiporus biennis]